jgi:PelD GGDEF domain
MDRHRQETEPDGQETRGRRPWRRRRRVPDAAWGMALLRREVDRSRRHAHPLALVRLETRAPGELERSLRDLERRVRSIDAVWAESRAVIVLLAESDRASAEGFLARLRAAAPAAVELDSARVACFPQDALTAESLRLALERGAARRDRLPADGPAVLRQAK